MNAALFLQIVLPLIPHVIRTVEQIMPGPKKGKRKRARALKTIESLAAAVPGLAVKAAELQRAAGAAIDHEVSRMNAAGELSSSSSSSAPVP